MDAKDLSEIVKNWVTSLTLVGGLIITVWTGKPYVEEKKREVEIKNDFVQVEAKFAKLSLDQIEEIEKVIKKKRLQYDVELAKPEAERSDLELDNLSSEISEAKKRKESILETVRANLKDKTIKK